GKWFLGAAGAIGGGLGFAIKTAADFEQKIANVNSVLMGTAEQQELLAQIARKTGAETVFSASEAADAMFYMAQAGLDVDQIIGALPGVIDMAAATQEDLAFASESVIAT